MIGFFDFFRTLRPLRASGSSSARHLKEYVEPYLPGASLHAPGTHVVISKCGFLRRGDRVSLLGVRSVGGVNFVLVERAGERLEVRASKIAKPHKAVKARGAAGLRAESKLVSHLKRHGLMAARAGGAGYTAGRDFYLKHESGQKFGGVERDKIYGESKIGLKAKFGAIALSHSREKGWHVSDKAKAVKPEYARSVESARVNGKPLLQHLNDHWGDPEGRSLKNVTTDTESLAPLHSYMRDRGVDVLHVHSHGTFRGGHSEKSDRTGIGLPRPRGTGRFWVSAERPGAKVHAVFRVHGRDDPSRGALGLKKSRFDLMRHDHAKTAREKLLGS